MSIRLGISQDHNLKWVQYSEKMSLARVRDAHLSMKSLAHWKENQDLIADVRDVEHIDIDFKKMMAAAEITSFGANHILLVERPKLALIIKDDHQFAMGRMLQSILDYIGKVDMRMYDQTDQALRWLGRDKDPFLY